MRLLENDEFERLDISSLSRIPVEAGSPNVVLALAEISRLILRDSRAKEFPDLITFGFFCRESNLRRYLAGFSDLKYRVGLGGLLHVAPGNIPMNFAFSLVMGMVGGNANYIRLPSRMFDQAKLALELIGEALSAEEFEGVSKSILFFRSAKGSENFARLVKHADGIIGWGGDTAIGALRSMPKRSQAREVYFASRTSSSILDAEGILRLSDTEMRVLVENFYNDTFLVDQNACSSPTAVFWLGSDDNFRDARDVFWSNLEKLVRERWVSWAPTGVRKVTDLFDFVQQKKTMIEIDFKTNALWTTSDEDVLGSTQRYGYFFEDRVDSVSEITRRLRENEQTITYFGVDPEDIWEEVNCLERVRVERICSVGRALDMGLVWDGKDTLPLLSRKALLR